MGKNALLYCDAYNKSCLRQKPIQIRTVFSRNFFECLEFLCVWVPIYIYIYMYYIWHSVILVIQALRLVRYLGLWLYIHRASRWIKQNKIAVLNWVFKSKSKKFLKIQECPSVDDSEGKKRLHGVWTASSIVKWFTLADFLYARNNVYHYREKLTRLLCHCFGNLEFPRKTNFACK